jgi:alpha-tubulin suppressor-like RCC1 family protein
MRFDEPEQKEPKLIIDFKAKAIQCVCGANYSIALDVKGDIYTWGKGPFKMDLSKAAMPSIIIRKKSPFIKVAAGTEHFGAINSSG